MRRALLTAPGGAAVDLTPYSLILGASKVRRSTDLINWNIPAGLSIANKTIKSIAYSPSLNLYVCVGYAGYIATSSDGGITWIDRSVDSTVLNYEVIWVAELNLFCYVGGYSGGKTIKTSPDGITWTERTTAGSTELYAVAWSPTQGAVAVGQNGAMYYSANLVSWSNLSGSAGTNTLNGVAWSPGVNSGAGAWCVCGYNNAVATSPTGNTSGSWTVRTGPSGTLTAVCAWDAVSSGGGFLIGNTAGGLWSSAAGASWTSRTSNTGSKSIIKIAMSPILGMGVILADQAVICTSTNGFTWTLRQQYNENLQGLIAR